MEANSTVFAFESREPRFVLELPRKNGPSQIVEWQGHEFVTRNEKLAKELREHPLFSEEAGGGMFWPLDLTPQKPRFARPHPERQVVSGARATR